MNTLAIARVAHQINRAFCAATGDFTQLDWNDAPEWQRNSAVWGVQYCLDNPNASFKDVHDEWLRVKVADGWVYGEVKDPIAKTHPCIMAYDQLPLEQKAKDYLFRAVVQELRS